MIRVKILKDYKNHRKGQVAHLSPNEAFGLIDRGIAIMSKDFTDQEYEVKTTKTFKQKSLKQVMEEE